MAPVSLFSKTVTIFSKQISIFILEDGDDTSAGLWSGSWSASTSDY